MEEKPATGELKRSHQNLIGNWIRNMRLHFGSNNERQSILCEIKFKNLFPIAQCIQIACLIPFSEIPWNLM